MSETQDWPLSAEDTAVASYLSRKKKALQQATNEAEAEWRTYLQNVATKMKLAKVRFDEERNLFVSMEGKDVLQNGRSHGTNPSGSSLLAERKTDTG